MLISIICCLNLSTTLQYILNLLWYSLKLCYTKTEIFFHLWLAVKIRCEVSSPPIDMFLLDGLYCFGVSWKWFIPVWLKLIYSLFYDCFVWYRYVHGGASSSRVYLLVDTVICNLNHLNLLFSLLLLDYLLSKLKKVEVSPTRQLVMWRWLLHCCSMLELIFFFSGMVFRSNGCLISLVAWLLLTFRRLPSRLKRNANILQIDMYGYL